MKVSLRLAKYYSNVDVAGIGNEELLRRIGAQLGAVEDIVDYGARYDGIVVVKVITCVPHPNADKLHVCTVDDAGVTEGVPRNDQGYVEVVCGAPNVREGLTVAWLPPGVTLPASVDKDPLVLEAREIRGVVSNGMLASAAELGLSDNHDGLLEIDSNHTGVGDDGVKPGTQFRSLYNLDDVVIDLENKMFTHRPDCFGLLGVVRELAGIQGLRFQSPDWYLNNPKFESADNLELNVSNELTELVPRFMAVAMSGVEIKPSPIWVQAVLTRVGIKPINNVVDVTNFVMYLTGQPLHAFDYDKIKARSTKPGIFPRLAKKGEKLTVLGGKEIELSGEEIVIATDRQAVALAGVMGGAETEVDESTKNIIIECATFDMYSVRRTSMTHGIFTDAVTRYSKGQSPLQNDRVLAYATGLMKDNASAQQASNVIDIKSEELNHGAVRVDVSFINSRLGSNLKVSDISKMLENVEFSVGGNDNLQISAPFWRRDIEIAEDIVEEVGRLYGYDKLPVQLPPRSAAATPKNSLRELQKSLRSKLASSGANEVLTYSFVHGDLLRRIGVDPETTSFHLRNAISPDLQYYRTSIIPGLLDKVYPNLRSDIVRSDDNEFALFEFGAAHIKGENDEEDLPKPNNRLGFVITADNKTAGRKYYGAAFYQAKHCLNSIVSGLSFEPLDNHDSPISAPFEPKRSAVIKHEGQLLGVIGEFKSSVREALKLPDYTAGFELDLDTLLDKTPNAGPYQPIGQFPRTQQDITLEVPSDVTYGHVYAQIERTLVEDESGYNYTIVPRDIFREEGSNTKRLTYRIWLSHYERTLTTDEVNALLNKIADSALESLGAKRI